MKYFGNCNLLFDWDIVVKQLKTIKPAHTGPDNSLEDLEFVKAFSSIIKIWNKNNIDLLKNGGTNNWDIYLPGVNFEKSIIKKFEDYVNADSIFSWISNIHPGCMSHWHWDASNKESFFETIPNLVRYCCFIMKPTPGHVFMIEDYAFSNSNQGDVWKWNDRKAWHGGVNYGFEEKYMFHFIGKSRE